MISNDELIARKFMLNGVYGKLGKEPKMKPFNLEAAINGAPVVTRDGREVKQLTYFVCDNPEPLAGVVGDTLRRWYNNGSYIDYIDDSPFDLFMAFQKRAGWINIYPRDDGNDSYAANASDVHASKEIADASCNPNSRLACIRIEWEE